MTTHLIVGAGGIGRETARALVQDGHEVVMLTRSGTDPGLSGVRAVAGDAADADLLARHARGAASIVNAVNPAYHRWPQDWPPIAAALLQAAEQTGAGLVTVSNLYLYGQVDAPMTEQTRVRPNGHKGQVRAQMWADALAAHDAGRVRATELRASDYFGPGASSGMSMLNQFVIARAAVGKAVRLPVGVPEAPHSWTYLPDIGRLAATLATDERAWGRAWHVPSAPARTFAQVAADVAAVAGVPAPAVSRYPAVIMRIARLASPTVRELDETRHEFERPFLLDATAATATFGLEATPWADALAATIASLAAARPEGASVRPATP